MWMRLPFLLFLLLLPLTTAFLSVPSLSPSLIHRRTHTHTHRHHHHRRAASPDGNDSPSSSTSSKKGLALLEWTNAILPQKTLVKTARYSWNLLWKTLMTELAPQSKDGSYVRPTYNFRGRLGTDEFPLVEGRYHVYVGNACPWCHRVTLTHTLRGLTQQQLSYSYAIDDPEKASRGGWAFEDTPTYTHTRKTQNHKDVIFNCKDLREVYELLSPGYRGRCTAPVLIDVKARKIVNNESSEIIRMLNLFAPHPPPPPPSPASAGGGEETTKKNVDLFPPSLRPKIEELNAFTYEKINNGVYRAGFATTQKAYDQAITDVFSGLDKVESILSTQRFLAGDLLTEADVRLFPTLIRFDAVYATLFKCSNKRIKDYPHTHTWLRHMYQLPGVRETVDIEGLIRSYFVQLFPLNPSGICPKGPTEEELGVLVPVEGGRKGGEIFAVKE